MSHDEQIEVVSACVSHVNGRIPVIAGAGANCTDEALNLAKRSEKAGADGLLVVTPYYNKATQKGLEEYYTTVGNSVDIPIIMYNVPGRTGTNIQPATAVKIAKSVDNIVAIKEASGDIGQVATLAALADGCLDIYSGNDDQVVPLLALGGKGVISVLSNVAPRETHDMVMKFLEGDVKGVPGLLPGKGDGGPYGGACGDRRSPVHGGPYKGICKGRCAGSWRKKLLCPGSVKRIPDR